MNIIGFVIGDGDGSPEFMRQATAWQEWNENQGHNCILHTLAVSTKPLAARYPEVEKLLKAESQEVSQVAFFCHGWADGLQLCAKNKIKNLAQAIRPTTYDNIRVTLYACSTAASPDRPDAASDGVGGDNGFADLLRDALCAEGAVNCHVDAHTCKGHTTKNPYLRRFEGLGVNTGGIGGQWLVTPGSQQWKLWSAALKAEKAPWLKSELRWRFPFMSAVGIHDYLARQK